MEVKIEIDEKYDDLKVVIYTKEITFEVSELMNNISNSNKKIIKGYKNDTMYLLYQNDLQSIYSENRNIIARTSNGEIYFLKNRLYELESILDNKQFLRISNSEIINFKMVKNIDFKLTGTILFNFTDGNKAYVSRRYMKKIKEFLEI